VVLLARAWVGRSRPARTVAGTGGWRRPISRSSTTRRHRRLRSRRNRSRRRVHTYRAPAARCRRRVSWYDRRPTGW